MTLVSAVLGLAQQASHNRMLAEGIAFKLLPSDYGHMRCACTNNVPYLDTAQKKRRIRLTLMRGGAVW